jgi:hypothetical protein
LATKGVQCIGWKSWHREVRKQLHQAAVSQKVGHRHPKLVGDAAPVDRGLTDRAAIVCIERAFRDDAFTIGEREGPRPTGGQIAQAGMRPQVLGRRRVWSRSELNKRVLLVAATRGTVNPAATLLAQRF